MLYTKSEIENMWIIQTLEILENMWASNLDHYEHIISSNLIIIICSLMLSRPEFSLKPFLE